MLKHKMAKPDVSNGSQARPQNAAQKPRQLERKGNAENQ
jgi:hypothetical protein